MNDELTNMPEHDGIEIMGADAEAGLVSLPLSPCESADPPVGQVESGEPILSQDEMTPVENENELIELSADAADLLEDAETGFSVAEGAVRRKNDRGFLIALLFFISAIFLGSLLTSLPAMTAQNWYFWIWLRMLVQIGGGLWFGYAFARTMGLGRPQIAAVFMLFGALISFNTVVDGFQGPQLIEGTISDYETETNYLHDRFGWQAGLRAKVEMEQADGSRLTLRPAGAQVGAFTETIRRCRELDQPVQFRMLSRLEIILEAHCFISI